MSACEKCWSDACGDHHEYRRLLESRCGPAQCTPEQQAGPSAGTCSKCKRRTAHQWTGECMACGHVNETGLDPCSDECVDDAIKTMVGSDVYTQGRADERAAIVAWLRDSLAEDFADAVECGDHEGKKPDQCTDCGAIIIGAHGCQGRPGDEEP